MADRKFELLELAIDIVQREGYAALSMRQLASESGMKLGSLQYHFKTWDSLVKSIADHVLDRYASRWGYENGAIEQASLPVFIDFILKDIETLENARLWPQLRAWGLVEPTMKEMLAQIYSYYLSYLERKFEELGSTEAKNEALTLMITLEGASVFVGRGSTHFAHLRAVRDHIIETLSGRFKGVSLK